MTRIGTGVRLRRWVPIPPAAYGPAWSHCTTLPTSPAASGRLLLVRTDRILKSPKHSRESMLEFRLDWVMLQRASEKNAPSLARNAIPGKTGRTMFLSGTGDD